MRTIIAILLSTFSLIGHAQQFSGDNQWVAPYGVGTFGATVGEEYSQLYAICGHKPQGLYSSLRQV
jgi:hypothetical protein